jgi:hypothetical protein
MSIKKQPENEGKIVETKNEKFLRITPKRVTKALNDILLIQKIMGNKSYDMSTEQVDKIVSKLENEVLKIKTIFESRTKSAKEKEVFEF